MRRFSTREFEDFLRRVDAELDRPCTIVLIGGGAVGLKYKGTHVTADLDLWTVSEATPSKTSTAPRRSTSRRSSIGTSRRDRR